jgi:outer membrane protein assembly factor BamB
VPGVPASASVPGPTDRGGADAAAAADDADAADDAADAGSTGGRDGTVLVDVRDGLVALDPTDGATRWTRLGVETTPPAVLPGPGLVVVGDADRGRLVAVDLATGDDRWTVAGVEPRRILAAGDAVVAAGWDGVAGSYAAATGRERWTFDAGAAAATASVVGDLVCLRTDDGRGHAVERDGGRVRWSIGPDGPTTVVGAVAGTLLTVGPEGGVDLLSPATGDPLVRSGASSYAVGPEGLYLAGDRAVEAFGSPPDRP